MSLLRILGKVKSEPWAITQEMMDTILDISERQNLSPDAVAQRLGRPLENTYDVEYRDGVAIMPVTGPLFRYANLFTALSGATSYDLLARDFAKAVDDPRVDAILLNIDSPGGEANGVSEFADQIAAARGKKPIVAYVGGLGASAAYWIAAAADEIVVADTALLGSIGTVMTVDDSRARDAKEGRTRHEIVSSQSPYKRVDPATDEGRSRLQALVDSLSDVFVNKVASYRGTDRDTVLENYGQGDILVGQAAVAAGLADRVGSFEGIVSELINRGWQAPVKSGAAASGDQPEVSDMDPKDQKAPAAGSQPEKLTAAAVAEQHPEAAAALRADGRADGVKSERDRVKAILSSPEAAGREELAQAMAFEGDLSPEQAVALLGKSPKAAAPKVDPLSQAMAGEKNPQVGADADAAAPSDPVAFIAAAAKKAGM